jgi:hypothetical protein
MPVIFSYLILLTPIVHYPDEGGNYETTDRVNRSITVIMRRALHGPAT